ncbi:MAG: zf-HC2 domain-containing protein [Candidatus Zixiibacteriota bacterium]
MNCQEALNLLYEIIDKEASEVDANQVRAHLDKCRHCFSLYRIEREMDSFIKSKLDGDSSSDVRLEDLRIRVRSKLDQIDAGESGSGGKAIPFRWTTMSLVAAAAVVVVVGATFLSTDLYRHHSTYAPFEDAHHAVLDHIDTWSDPAVATGISSWAADHFGYRPNARVAEFTLAGGRQVVVDGVDIGQFFYTDKDEVVSVFVAPADRFAIPDDLSETRTEKSHVEYFSHHCRGCQLVYHRVGDVVVVTASVNHELSLLEFDLQRGPI